MIFICNVRPLAELDFLWLTVEGSILELTNLDYVYDYFNLICVPHFILRYIFSHVQLIFCANKIRFAAVFSELYLDDCPFLLTLIAPE